MKKRWFIIFFVFVVLLTACSGQGVKKSPEEEKSISTSDMGEVGEETRIIQDMRGKEVEIPKEIQKVAIIDKGFILENMVAMGLEDKIVAQGGLVDAPQDEKRDLMLLAPKILEMPTIGYPTKAVDFEALAASNPDLVLLRNSEYIKESEITKQVIETIEKDLKLPLIVINGAGVYDEVTMDHHYEGIKLLGELFQVEDRANEIVDHLKGLVDMIYDRTKDIKEEDKAKVMYMAFLADESVATVWGKEVGDAKFTESYVNIKNAYQEETRTKMSAEQILAIDPDALVLGTNSVVPYPNIIEEEEKYKDLRSLQAVENKRVTCLGKLTWWGDYRLEFPSILMISAKVAYPEKFEDIALGEWIDQYHQFLYPKLSQEEIKELKKLQAIEWVDEL